MAGLQSLGLHEPSALAYLVNEGYLETKSSSLSYVWDYQQVYEETECLIDEVLRTASCVAWSRDGIVKRVYNLDIEGETITHAFTTSFEASRETTALTSSFSSQGPTSRALVVVLKTQVHIFLLSGDTHVVPLSFEVEKAIPAARGFLLQRRIPTGPGTSHEVDAAHAIVEDPSHIPPADDTDQRIQHGVFSSTQGVFGRKDAGDVPRTFAFPEVLSELGVVVHRLSYKQEHLHADPVLPPDEDLIYVSAYDELHEIHDTNNEPIHLAVTINSQAANLTLWRVLFKGKEHNDDRRQRAGTDRPSAKRKSSNVYGRQTGAATPTARAAGGLRESLGPLPQIIPENSMFDSIRDRAAPQTGDLAAQLGHEFEQVGVQTRSARRVSSMLARTDLGGANDRSAFNEMSTGTFGRKSFGRNTGRGESLGGFSDRQSFGARRRSSFQAASSMYSDGTSFLDIPAAHLLEDAAALAGTDTLGESHRSSTITGFSRDVAFLKVKVIPHDITRFDGGQVPALKVITLLAPDRSTADDRRSRIISVCIMDKGKQEMMIINVAVKVALSANKHKDGKLMYDLKAVEIQRGQAIVDACSVVEDRAKRLLILTRTREDQNVLHLEAPWSVSYRVHLPSRFKVFDTSGIVRGGSPASKREIGMRRVIASSEVRIELLRNCESQDQVLFLDTDLRCHRLRLQLMPTEPMVRSILRMCNFVLAPEFFDSMLVAWWEVKRWIEVQGHDANIEWTAMTVTLFILAVPFIGNLQSRPAQGPRQKKGGLLRSSTGTTVDLSQWDLMQEIEANSMNRPCTEKPPWTWIRRTTQAKMDPRSPSKHARTVSADVSDHSGADTFLIRCTNLARDFLQSPGGENAIGPEGYLPTAVNKDRATRRTAVASILVGLHLLREETKLHDVASIPPKQSSDDLASVIVQIASWLRWKDWRLEPGQYFYHEISEPGRWLMESSVIDDLDVPAQPFRPPSIFEYIEDSIVSGKDAGFPSLLDLLSQSRPVIQGHPLWSEAASITPRLFAITAFIAQLRLRRKPKSIVKQMTKCGIDGRMLETLPIGIAAVCHQAIVTLRGQLGTDWSSYFLPLTARTDIKTVQTKTELRSGPRYTGHTHDALRDYHTLCSNAIDVDSISRWDTLSEIDRQAITKLIFNEDRRFQEASKIVNQTRPPVVECKNVPGVNEADFLEAQKVLAVHVTRRTLSVAAGRAMMHFNARVPLLTERVPIPAFSLQCVMKSQGTSDDSQPITLSADKALFTEDKVCWAFFHNGASAGLMISRDTQWIDTSWILYNKPPELTNRHAGFLLALGLNGHLKSLAKWVAFKYLTPKHTMTSVGLLLGLAASYLGTMDTLIARLLSVHVTRLLPVGAAELNLSPLTQTTGIIGVGLLYCNSQHRRMSEIMLSEIENNDAEDRSGEEPILRDEGYRLAAGFSLGLINLGQGNRLHSLHDMAVTERLLNVAIGTKNVNLVHVLDRATAGAVVAVALIYLKTNDETVAHKIDIPDTMHQFDYVRPDMFLLRTLARHLIMWDSITPTHAFVRDSLPPIFHNRAHLATTKVLSTDDMPFFNVIAGVCFAMSLRFAGSHRQDARDLLVSYLDQFLRLSRLPALNYDAKVTLNGVRNCLDVLALSCATVMAGSGDVVVMRRLRALHGRTDKDTPFGSHLAAHMALGVLFLSGGTATFGTSNLAVAALVISLYPLFPGDVLDNKAHLQALRHLWVLAVENRCLIAKDVETQHVVNNIEAVVELNDGRKQTLRAPGLLPAFDVIRSVSFQHESYWPVTVDFDSRVSSDIQSHVRRDLGNKGPQSTREHLKAFGTGLKVFLQRRVAYEKSDNDVFFSELQALDAARGVPSADANSVVNERWRQLHGHSTNAEHARAADPFDWVFGLESLKHLDFAERSLVTDETGQSSGRGRDVLKETAVDSVLEFNYGCLGIGTDHADGDSNGTRTDEVSLGAAIDRDKLWQLRLLFAWAERWEKDEEEQELEADSASHPAPKGSVRWIKKEVIEQLRSKVWKMAGGQDE